MLLGSPGPMETAPQSPSLRKPCGSFLVVLLGLQIFAYNRSWLTATHPTECIVLPIRNCPIVMASGYAIAGPAGELVSILVPLLGYIALAGAIVGPPLYEEGRLSRGVRYLLVGIAIALVLASVSTVLVYR